MTESEDKLKELARKASKEPSDRRPGLVPYENTELIHGADGVSAELPTQEKIEDTKAEDPEEQVQQAELDRQINASLSKLTWAQKRVYIGLYIQFKTPKELAAEIGVDVNAIYQIRDRALAKLKGAELVNSTPERRVITKGRGRTSKRPTYELTELGKKIENYWKRCRYAINHDEPMPPPLDLSEFNYIETLNIFRDVLPFDILKD